MIKEMICIQCPRGCHLKIDTETLEVTGNFCPSGAKYAVSELTLQERTMTTTVKVLETFDAIDKGADEIDMVINIGRLKSRDYAYVSQEIALIKQACGDHILKVIIETCMLADEEKIKMCEIVTGSGADYIKTSTGFASGGATVEDVKLFAEHVGSGVKIKAAGGISSLEDAEKFMELGADRLGTSRIVKIIKAG